MCLELFYLKEVVKVFKLYWKESGKKKLKEVVIMFDFESLKKHALLYKAQIAIDNNIKECNVDILIAKDSSVLWLDFGYLKKQYLHHEKLLKKLKSIISFNKFDSLSSELKEVRF